MAHFSSTFQLYICFYFKVYVFQILMSVCKFIFTINVSKLRLSQNDHNLTIINYWQRWHMKNKAPLMLFTFFCMVLCWRRVGLMPPFQLLGSGANWGFEETMKRQPQWLLLICAASDHFINPEYFGRQHSLWYSLTSPAWSSPLCGKGVGGWLNLISALPSGIYHDIVIFWWRNLRDLYCCHGKSTVYSNGG